MLMLPSSRVSSACNGRRDAGHVRLRGRTNPTSGFIASSVTVVGYPVILDSRLDRRTL